MIGRAAAVVAALGLATACTRSSGVQTGGGAGQVRVTLGGVDDTVGFRIPVRARRCGNGRGVVLDGALHGNGLLVWLRDGTRPPGNGNYPLLSRGDSAAPLGAIASVRFVVGTVAHGVTIDSGTAVLTHGTAPFAVHINGSGSDLAASGRRAVFLQADDVPLEPDTVTCVVQL